MRIISWNMAHTKASKMAEAWKWLDDESDVDVLLLQETIWPELLSDKWLTHSFSRKYEEKGGNWGTAVLCRMSGYSPYIPNDDDYLLKSIKGSFALLKPSNSEDPWLGSIHSNHQIVPASTAELARKAEVLKESIGNKYREVEIFAHELKRIAGNAKFVIGGDLNLSLLWDQSTRKDTSRNIFSNLNTLGFYRLGPLTQETEIQTYWKTNSGPFQLDHLFSDSFTVKNLGSFATRPELVTARKLSDHSPLVVEFLGV